MTDLDWISHYGCKYVVHGDDITSDSNGEDCYRFVKQAGRFKVVKRTPGISTTDLVGRMLLCTKHHFIRSLQDTLEGREGAGTAAEREQSSASMKQRLHDYASDASGLAPGVEVYMYHESSTSAAARIELFVNGKRPKRDQRIVYVDGGFDLFSSGHIEFLRSVVRAEDERACRDGRAEGAEQNPSYVVAGIHNDEVINLEKGLNYPIMNIFERGLCLLQCKVGLQCMLLIGSLADADPMRQVYRCRGLRRAIRAYGKLPASPSHGTTGGRVSRPDGVHAAGL